MLGIASRRMILVYWVCRRMGEDFPIGGGVVDGADIHNFRGLFVRCCGLATRSIMR
jgi:hypothetical protein